MQTITLPSMSADEYCKDVDTIERCECCGHHRGGQLVTVMTRDNVEHTLCEKCARDNFIRAYDGSWHDLRPYRIDLHPRNRQTTEFYDGPFTLYRYGKFIPRFDWQEYRMRFCDDCNRVQCGSDLSSIYVLDSNGYEEEMDVCQSCLREYLDGDYYYCASCNELHHVDEMRWSEGEDDWICDSCYDNDYFTCEHCEGVYHTDHLNRSEDDTYYCDQCWEEYCAQNYDGDSDEDNEPSDMHHYGYKPDNLTFYKTDADARYLVTQASRGISTGLLYMGVELEYSHECNTDRHEHSDYIQSHFNDGNDSHFYQKSDSSLCLGIEQVSHPMTFNYWLEEMRDVMDTGLDDTDQYVEEGGSDGFHIHISRKGMGLYHRIKFGAFFELCRNQVELVARRRGSGYAKFIHKDTMQNIASPKSLLRELSHLQGDRYRCVNWNNDKTAEVRVFKTTTDSTEFYAALALVHGAYQFTKRIGWHKMFYAGKAGVLWDWFLDFMAQDKRYLDLFDLLDYRSEDMGTSAYDEDLPFFFGNLDVQEHDVMCAAIIMAKAMRREQEQEQDGEA